MSDIDVNERREDFIARMTAEGFAVVTPKSNQLQIDIDSEQDYERFDEALACWNRNHENQLLMKERLSKSGWPRRHITIDMPFDLDHWQRIALQAVFGSDHMRELLSAIRLMRGDTIPTLFVEPASL